MSFSFALASSCDVMTQAFTPTLQFCGGAGTVTGSRYLLQTGASTVLLDCGLFQGLKALRLRNWEALPFEARAIDAVVLSHAHLDHVGALPILVQQGFRGRVHCTAATAALASVVLRDSAKLQEEDAAHANRHGWSKHHPARPLVTLADAERAIELFETHAFGKKFAPTRDLSVTFFRGGHILGAAIVHLSLAPGPLTLTFSGDLGRWNRPLLRDPETIEETDVLLLESTYGDRQHEPDPVERLAQLLTRAHAQRGVVLVPAFAIGRTQELLWILRNLEDTGRVPVMPVFVDSPMARKVTDLYRQHHGELDLEAAALRTATRDAWSSRALEMVETADESKALNARQGPMVIIAGSGMATGGRILHHFRRWLPDPTTTVVLVGYQAAGTRGRALQEGSPWLTVHGERVPVRAAVEALDGLSAHADQDELLRWLGGFRKAPAATWLVHGEPAAAQALARRVRDELKWPVSVAVEGARVELRPREAR